jgi:hypothetical protein
LGKRIKGKNDFVVFEDWDIENWWQCEGINASKKTNQKEKHIKRKLLALVQHELHWLLGTISYLFHLIIVFWLFVMELVLFYLFYLRSGISDVV